MTIEQKEAADRYKRDIEASVNHDEKMGNYVFSSDKNETKMEWLRERGTQLDENEAGSRQEYIRQGCEKETGLSADGYRHQTITEAVREEAKNAERQRQTAIEQENQNEEEMSL